MVVMLARGIVLTILALSWGATAFAGRLPLEFLVRARPLAIELEQGGKPVAALDGGTASALYIAGVRRSVDVLPPYAAIQDGVEVTLQARTTDDREVRVLLTSAEEGAVQITVSVEKLRSWERIGVRLRVGETEGFYGLMERVVQGLDGRSFRPEMEEGLDLRGQTVRLYTLPTISLYSPFFVSSAGYGVFVESDWPGTYRFGRDARGRSLPTQVTIEQEGPELVLRIIPGPTPLEAVERYARMVGTTVLPPRWAFGPWRWRDEIWDLQEFYDGTPSWAPFNSMVVEDILMMDALGIPCTAYIIDRPWAGGPLGYGDLEFDPVRLPRAREMIAWMEKRGVHTMLWVAPWLTGELRRGARQAGFTVRGAVPWLWRASLIDFTDAQARQWWQELLAERVADGIVGFKLDRADEKVPDGILFRGTYADGTSYREGHNAYPAWFAEAAAGAFEAASVDEYVLLVRAGWVGSARYAIAWGGDAEPSQWGLRASIIGVQRAAAMSFPLWGSDTGGYGHRPPREVLARWLAFSAFTPLMEVGPTGDLAPWSWAPDELPARVDGRGYHFQPVYDRELLAVWHLYANLRRDVLADYTYSLAVTADERGTPVVRPMPLAYPEVPEYRDLWEQYLLGPDLLVRPVWREGDRFVSVHVPPGRWVDAWSGEVVQGPQEIVVEAPLHVIPLFVRAGSDISLGELAARWEAARDAVAEKPDLAELQRQAGFGEELP